MNCREAQTLIHKELDRELSEEERAASGVPEGLIRYAVGIEDVEDLQDDLERALAEL